MPAAILLFSVLSYFVFFGVFVYLVLFVGGGFLAAWVPLLEPLKTVDSGSWAYAIPGVSPAASNLVILIAFGLQHSIMARKPFKRVLTKVVPEAAERSVFVNATSVVLLWMYMAWQPMGGEVWRVEGTGGMVLTVLFLCGASLVLWSTFMINHFELFGLAQAWRNFRGSEAPAPELRTPAVYKISRHPLYLGIVTLFWATPVMTTGHLLFAAVWTAYVFIGIGYEERDLIDTFGDRYRDYMSRVPQLLPFGRRK
jgi:protein-S-isoprenylcysteine O-methyltransferase Ste14